MFGRGFNISEQSGMSFADSADISDWAAGMAAAMASRGIINGYEDGTFRPSDNITRAETVKILDGVAAPKTDTAQTPSPGVTGETPVTGTGGIYSSGGPGIGPGYSGGGSSGGGSQSLNITVTFDANGGKFANGTGRYSVNIPAGSVISGNISVPASEGRMFGGWYKTKNAADNLDESQAFDIKSSVRKSLTVYAGWYSEGKSTVTFNLSNGTPAIPAAEVQNGGHVSAPDIVPERAHYTFRGWFSDAAAANAFDFLNTVIKKDTTIYAGWTIDPEYADKEIIIPSKTDNYVPGEITAAPASLLPGENTYITFVPPKDYTLKDNSTVVVKYIIIDESGAETEQMQTFTVANSSFNFVMPVNIKNGSIRIQAEFTAQVGPATPKPTKDPNATPEPTPTPTKEPLVIGEQTVQWTAGTADDNRKKGDVVMPGLSLMFDVTSKGNAKVTIDGRSFERYISSSENGSWGGIEATGTALKYEASEDGEFTVYANKLGKEKSLYITRSGSSNKEEKDGENVKKLNDTEGDINLSLSIIVEKGQTYYAYVSGSKGRFVGAGFAPAINGDPSASRPPVTTPTPTPTPSQEPIEVEGIDMTLIDKGTSVSKSADGYTEIRKRANGEIIYCPTIGEEPEIELPIAAGYGDKESYYVFRNETDAAQYKYTANIPDLLARTPNKTDSEDTMVGVLRVKSPCDGTLKLIYARNGSASDEGYSLYAYNGINGEQQLVSSLQNGGVYYETKAIDIKTGDVIYFDSDWEKGIKYSMAVFTPKGGSVEPPASEKPDTPVQTAEPSAVPSAVPSKQPDAPVQSPASGDEIMWTFGDGTDKPIEPGTLEFDGGLSYITTDAKSTFASGGKVDGVEFAGRIKLGGKSTFDESKCARVFVFTPSVSGTVTVYFTHGSSKDANPRHVLVYQNGVEAAKLPVQTTESAAGSCEVAAGAPVYIGGDNNIGVFGIKFTPNK